MEVMHECLLCKKPVLHDLRSIGSHLGAKHKIKVTPRQCSAF